MRLSIILTLFMLLNQSLVIGQIDLDSTENLINDLIVNINELPKTNLTGVHASKFEKRYSMSWDNEDKILILTDQRFKPNSDEKFPDKHISKIDIKTLHKDGVQLRDLHNNGNISLQIFTANNNTDIKQEIHKNGEYRFGMYQDRLTIGSWDSNVLKSELDLIQAILIQIIELNTNWNEDDAPDIRKKVIPTTIKKEGFEYSKTSNEKEEKDSTLFINSTIEEPALFMNAKTQKDNKTEISNYLSKKLKKKKIKFEGRISGKITISKSGKIESYKSFNLNTTKVDEAVKEIVLSMPDWTIGKQKGNNVKTQVTFFIKK